MIQCFILFHHKLIHVFHRKFGPPAPRSLPLRFFGVHLHYDYEVSLKYNNFINKKSLLAQNKQKSATGELGKRELADHRIIDGDRSGFGVHGFSDTCKPWLLGRRELDGSRESEMNFRYFDCAECPS